MSSFEHGDIHVRPICGTEGGRFRLGTENAKMDHALLLRQLASVILMDVHFSLSKHLIFWNWGSRWYIVNRVYRFMFELESFCFSCAYMTARGNSQFKFSLYSCTRYVLCTETKLKLTLSVFAVLMHEVLREKSPHQETVLYVALACTWDVY